MSKKKLILDLITKGPNWLNIIALRLNKHPNLLFGKKYKEVKEKFYTKSSSHINIFLHAQKNTPFYAEKYKSTKVQTNLDFSEKVEFIDKDIVTKNLDKFLSQQNHKNLDSCTTGGTSGKPLQLFLPKDRFVYELGALHALWGKIGFNFSTRAVIRNHRVLDRDYIINPITKEIIFDGFRSDNEYQEVIYRTMKRLNVEFLHAYTSNAERFFNFVLNNALEYDFIKGIITSSENLYDHQTQLFSKLHDVKHMNFYGHSEKLILGGSCPKSSTYHFYDSYGKAELVDEHGKEIDKIGEIGELVGTTNYNIGMPLIRYRTGDYAIKAPQTCPYCGFQGLSVSKIMGRWFGERIYNKNNSYVSTTALNLHSKIYDHLDGIQYYHNAPGYLKILIIPGRTYSIKIEEELLQYISNKFEKDMEVEVVKVKEMKKNKNGKFLMLIKE